MPVTMPSEDLPVECLSGRQRQVLELIAGGRTIKAAARSLGISRKTVELHKASLYRKLGTDHIPGLVLYAVRQGVITVNGPWK